MATYRVTLALLSLVFLSIGCSTENGIEPSDAEAGEPIVDATTADSNTADSDTSNSAISENNGAVTTNTETALNSSAIYFNDFSSAADGNRIDQFVAYRDPFVVNHVVGSSDHAPTDGINCSAPDQTRDQTRANPVAQVYQCLPGPRL